MFFPAFQPINSNYQRMQPRFGSPSSPARSTVKAVESSAKERAVSSGNRNTIKKEADRVDLTGTREADTATTEPATRAEETAEEIRRRWGLTLRPGIHIGTPSGYATTFSIPEIKKLTGGEVQFWTLDEDHIRRIRSHRNDVREHPNGSSKQRAKDEMFNLFRRFVGFPEKWVDRDRSRSPGSRHNVDTRHQDYPSSRENPYRDRDRYDDRNIRRHEEDRYGQRTPPRYNYERQTITREAWQLYDYDNRRGDRKPY